MLRIILPVMLFISFQGFSQNDIIRVVEEKLANRLALYGINETETDYDVKIVVTGTGIRQSKGKPRKIRVPSASKVLLKTLIVERGKFPSYSYELELNDSLSRRSIRKPYESIKINPKKQIMVYLTDPCTTCDTIMGALNSSKYKFKYHVLSEKPEIRQTLKSALQYTKTPLDSISNPVISLAGTLYTTIESYEELIKVMNREEGAAVKEEEEGNGDKEDMEEKN